MKDLFNVLLGQLGDKGIQEFGKLLGKDNEGTKDALSTATGLIFDKLGRNAEKSDTEKASILDAITNDHDGSELANLSDILNGKSDEEWSKILSHVFGNKMDNVKKLLAKNNDLDEKTSGNLLTRLAPLVMGILGKQESAGNLDLWDIVNILKGSGKSANDNSSLAMTVMTKFLDKDGDGDITDDLLAKGVSFLKGMIG